MAVPSTHKCPCTICATNVSFAAKWKLKRSGALLSPSRLGWNGDGSAPSKAIWADAGGRRRAIDADRSMIDSRATPAADGVATLRIGTPGSRG